MRSERLRKLEQLAREISDRQQLVLVQFDNGQRRLMRLPDVIGYLRENETGLTVTGIEGNGGDSAGVLAELLRGIINV